MKANPFMFAKREPSRELAMMVEFIVVTLLILIAIIPVGILIYVGLSNLSAAINAALSLAQSPHS